MRLLCGDGPLVLVPPLPPYVSAGCPMDDNVEPTTVVVVGLLEETREPPPFRTISDCKIGHFM